MNSNYNWKIIYANVFWKYMYDNYNFKNSIIILVLILNIYLLFYLIIFLIFFTSKVFAKRSTGSACGLVWKQINNWFNSHDLMIKNGFLIQILFFSNIDIFLTKNYSFKKERKFSIKKLISVMEMKCKTCWSGMFYISPDKYFRNVILKQKLNNSIIYICIFVSKKIGSFF